VSIAANATNYLNYTAVSQEYNSIVIEVAYENPDLISYIKVTFDYLRLDIEQPRLGLVDLLTKRVLQAWPVLHLYRDRKILESNYSLPQSRW